MSETVHTSPGHPLRDFATRVNLVLDGLAHTPAWSMTTTEQGQTLVDLARAQARIEELRLRVLAAADNADLAGDTAATSTAAWLAHATRIPPAVGHRDVKLARTLDTTLGATRDALAAGDVDVDQARVIAETITGLPIHAEDAGDAVNAAEPGEPDLAGRVEKHLLALAGDHDARTLKRLARHVLDVIDPECADRALGRRLHAEEAAAARATMLQLFDNGDGTHTGRFKIAPCTPRCSPKPSRRSPTPPTTTQGRGKTPTPPSRAPAPAPAPAQRTCRERHGVHAPSCSGRRSVSSSNDSTRPGSRPAAASTPPS